MSLLVSIVNNLYDTVHSIRHVFALSYDFSCFNPELNCAEFNGAELNLAKLNRTEIYSAKLNMT